MRRFRRSLLLMSLALGLGSARGQTPIPPLRLSTALAQAPLAPAASEDALPWTDEVHQWQPGSAGCARRTEPRWDRLTLAEAVAQALCADPGLVRALSDVMEQSAGVDLAHVDRQPRWSVNADYSAARNFNATGLYGRTLAASLGLNWVLFDFGRRSASLRAARQNVAGANASREQATLEALRDVVRRYGAAVLATAALDATEEAETSAQQTAAAAQARYQAQVGNQIDRLQAQTALAQASLERVKAHGAWEDARSQLALALGARIDQPLRLADWQRWAERRGADLDLPAVRESTLLQHPRLRAAQAQLDALRARLDATHAENRGSLSLSTSAGSSRNWGAAGAGNIPTANAALVLNIPLFNGAEADAQSRQVLAQIQAREADLETVRRDIDGQLWQALQTLQTSAQGMQAAQRLLESSEATYRVAQGRYKAGVGSMQDLLGAQSTLADARRQRVAALVEQLNAQAQLAVATGRLGPPDHPR